MAKLLIEHSNQVELLTENTSDGKQLYIEGIFAQAEVKNGNKRYYRRQVMECALDQYISDYVSKNRALGEINHPDRPFADPSEAAIRITEMKWDGNNVYGKALVLNTFKGQQVKGLLEGGFNMGVSTRGLGTLTERGGMKYVDEGYMMTAVDCVDGPSGPDCYVNSLVESSWINKGGVWVPADAMNENVQGYSEEFLLEKIDQYVKGILKNRK